MLKFASRLLYVHSIHFQGKLWPSLETGAIPCCRAGWRPVRDTYAASIMSSSYYRDNVKVRYLTKTNEKRGGSFVFFDGG